MGYARRRRICEHDGDGLLGGGPPHTRAHSCPAQHCWTYFKTSVLGAGSARVGPRGQSREKESSQPCIFSRARAACHRYGLWSSVIFKIPQNRCPSLVAVLILMRRSWHWHSVQATASSSAPPTLLTMSSLTQDELRGNLAMSRTRVSLWTPATSFNNDISLIQHRSPVVTRMLLKNGNAHIYESAILKWRSRTFSTSDGT